ncbi:MAG: hypothetical protein Q9179_007055, partial [Wetmoreana sp. 5 TL-2023]
SLERRADGSSTTARISPSDLAFEHTSGSKMQSKLMDFAIYIEPSQLLKGAVHKHLCRLKATRQSINQTTAPLLRQKPIAVNWESKRPFTGGESSDIHSAVWVGAQLVRLRQILDTSSAGGPKEKNICLPALSALGHQLHLLILEEEETQNVCSPVDWAGPP